MEQIEIYAKLTDIFRDLFNDSPLVLKPEMTPAAIPEWDSFNHINLVVAIEAEFRIKFQTVELEAMHNVGAFINTIQRRLASEGR